MSLPTLDPDKIMNGTGVQGKQTSNPMTIVNAKGMASAITHKATGDTCIVYPDYGIWDTTAGVWRTTADTTIFDPK